MCPHLTEGAGRLGPDPSSPLGVQWWMPSRLLDLAFDPAIPPDLSFWAQLVESREALRTQHASCLLIARPGKGTGTDL